MAVYAFDIRVAWMSGTFTAAGLFFGCGAYFAIMKQDLTDMLWKWRYAIVPVAVILMVMQTYSGSAMGDSVSRMIHPWLVIFQSAALIIVALAYVNPRLPKAIHRCDGSRTFPHSIESR